MDSTFYAYVPKDNVIGKDTRSDFTFFNKSVQITREGRLDPRELRPKI